MPVTPEIFRNIPDDAIDGNKIHGGTISSFSSTGITDLATKTSLTVSDGRITIDTVRTGTLEGHIKIDGSIAVKQNIAVKENSQFEQDVYVGKDLTVSGEIRAVSLKVDNLIAKTTTELKEPIHWSVDSGGIEGKGLVFKRSKKEVDFFIYKSNPARIHTNLDIELYKTGSFRIDGTPVLTVDTLGPGITKSSLRKVGRLQDLTVVGDAIIGEHVFYNSKSNRLGIGTDAPYSCVGIVDNGIEISIGSLYANTGNIGTIAGHDFGIITDGVQRVKFSKSGKVEFGDALASNADVAINGKLFVKELIVDQRQDRTAPLEFRAVKGDSNYGKGMVFTGQGINKQFIFASEPDQFFSTEHINLAAERGYLINGSRVLTEHELGPKVTKSYLKELGDLSYLKVDGEVNLGDVLLVKQGKVLIGDVEISTKNGVKIQGTSFEFRAENQSISINNDRIMLGNKDRPSARAIVNGTLAIGMQNVGENAQLEVAGNIRFADRLFMTGVRAPTTGNYRKGDIVWNSEPRETGYVGWVCVREGNPGIWRGFGQIGIE